MLIIAFMPAETRTEVTDAKLEELHKLYAKKLGYAPQPVQDRNAEMLAVITELIERRKGTWPSN